MKITYFDDKTYFNPNYALENLLRDKTTSKTTIA